MTGLAGRRWRALAAGSVLALSVGLLAACNSEGDLALTPKPKDSDDKSAPQSAQLAPGDKGCVRGGAGAAAAGANLPVKMPLFNDLGSFSHTISTKNRDAQAFFDQGYRYLFNFNHNAAILSFQEALKRDPNCAMCWWGIAFAYGPNINMPMMPEASQPAFEAVQHAQSLAANASPEEQAWIAAIAKRYTNNAKIERHTLDLSFAEAMKQVVAAYPADLDAAVLYAEALMDTSPWDYWQADKKTAKAGLEDLIPTLEGVLKKNPRHPGAEHLYIHAVEAVAPQRAERYADLLRGQMPGAGHIVHMPSHIYNRIGRYAEAVSLNEAATKSDEAYFAATNDIGLYAGMYYVHNMHFVWTSSTTEGRSAEALDYAARVVKATQPEFAAAAPPAELFLPTLLYAQLRFGKWDEILATPKFEHRFAFANAMWHYAQARAYAAKKDIAHAQAEVALIASSFPKSEADRFASGFGVPGQQLIDIATHMAQAEVYRAQKKSRDEIAELQTAVKLQDAVPYTEPPYWDFPTRQYLGAALLAAGRAKEAENVYRQDLREWPKNGWSLFGLSEALKKQGKAKEAKQTKREFDLAWSRADVTLSASRF